jgi:hypothetical protein
MPESVTDRCTKSHEYIFLLTKSERYFYDAEAIKEAAKQYGLVPDPNAAHPAPDNRSDLDAIRRTQQASAGAPPNAPMDFGDALDRARTKEEWEAIMANAPAEAGVQLRATVGGYKLIN